jgi:translation initiation factor 3 subunit B
MATAYDQLPEGDEIDESEIDFSDLREQFQVRLEEGLDAFIVLDGLPITPEENIEKLKRFITKKLNPVGRIRENGFYMPLTENEPRKSKGLVSIHVSRNAL